MRTNVTLLSRFTSDFPRKQGYTYASAVRNFLRCAPYAYTKPETITLPTLHHWVRAQTTHAHIDVAKRRALIVTKFFDYLVKHEVISRNPLFELCQVYGKPLSVLIAVLNCDNYQRNLFDSQPLPKFGSFLGAAIKRHIGHMRSLGYKYETDERFFRRFDRFLQVRNDLEGRPLQSLIDEWSAVNRSIGNQYWAMHYVGRLSQSMHRHDKSVAIVESDRQITRRHRTKHRKPHIFSEDEVRKLFIAAKQYPNGDDPLKCHTVECLLTIAFCVGLRLGELARLDIGDIDLSRRVLHIRDSKFWKSRQLPLSKSAMGMLIRYLRRRNKAGAPNTKGAGLFWNSHLDRRYSYKWMGAAICSLFRSVGLKKPCGSGRQGPRPHDLRHTFVVTRMIHWYRAGLNPQSQLPHLVTYLGHRDINSTLAYLTTTQELFNLAGERFRKFSSAMLSAANCDSTNEVKL